MEQNDMEELRYPIGQLDSAGEVTEAQLARFISDIESLPDRLRQAVAGLSAAQLDGTYRPGGWTARQLVHHIADSHINGYTRIKLALTEECPTVKTLAEEGWAELADGRELPVEVSLQLIEALHRRWAYLLRSLGPDELVREFRHPENGVMTVSQAIRVYAWHGNHHLGHIRLCGGIGLG